MMLLLMVFLVLDGAAASQCPQMSGQETPSVTLKNVPSVFLGAYSSLIALGICRFIIDFTLSALSWIIIVLWLSSEKTDFPGGEMK